MVANACLRLGNTAASNNCTAFMEETFKEALKEQSVGLVRADSGFYTEEILEYLECNKYNYIIATRLYPNVKNKIHGLQDWIQLTKGIELNEIQFCHQEGKSRRYIVIRKKVEDRPKASGKLLFEDLPGYRHLLCYKYGLAFRSNMEHV
jgi:hypothetical protein